MKEDMESFSLSSEDKDLQRLRIIGKLANLGLPDFTWKMANKGKCSVLAIVLLTGVTLVSRSTLQSRKWQLIGMS